MTRDFFTFNITENVLYDALQNPDKFQWRLGYHFNGSRSKNLAGGYGGDVDCESLYALLGDPFLERYFDTVYPYIYLKEEGDTFIYEAGQEIFPYIEEVGFSRNEASEIKNRLATDRVRFENAEERLRSVEERLRSVEERLGMEKERLEMKKERANDLLSEIDFIKETAHRTLSGELDRRYKEYRSFTNLTDDLDYVRDQIDDLQGQADYLRNQADALQNQLDSLGMSYARERKRLENTQERYNKSIHHAKEMLSSAKEVFSSYIRSRGEDFAKDIREDIINRLASGSLPLKTHIVKPFTQMLRKKAGLEPTPRFYASGQFINSVVVDIKLEKR
jgi:predicted  nucleic acid-binding Zn-ribbon protein